MAFDSVLRNGFAVATLLSICVAAYFQATGGMHLLRARFGNMHNAGNPLRVHSLPGQSATPASAGALLTRNPFDSSKRNLLTGADDRARAMPTNLGLLAAPVCEGVRVRIVTESPDSSWSTAMMEGPGEPARMRRPGDRVGPFRVEYIGFNPHVESPSVWLSKDEEVCQSVLFAPPELASEQTRPDMTPSTSASALSGETASGIRRVSETEFIVNRTVVDGVLAVREDLTKVVRVVPEAQGGTVLGIRLFGIRPGSLLGSLGFRNGDRLEVINGFDLTTPKSALEAYARLRTASELSVQLTRQGQPVNIDYHIQAEPP